MRNRNIAPSEGPSPGQEAPTIDLGISGWRAPLHSHIAYLWETESDFAEAVGFVEAGLRGSDHCVVIGDRADNERILAVLKRRGVEAAELQNGGQLTVLDRVASAGAMVGRIAAVFEAAATSGAAVLRLFGTVGWGRKAGPSDAELLSIEARLSDLSERFPCVILCLHEVRALTGMIVRHGVFGTHPQILTEDGTLGNPLFVPFDRLPTRLASLLEELSNQQGSRETLRRQTEMLRTVFDNIPVMISVFDPSGRLILVNREWERVLGWSLQEAQDLDILAAVYPDPGSRREVLEFMQKAEQRWQDFKTRTKNGRVIETSWLRVGLSNGTQIGFGLDLTERKRLEEGVRTSEALLAEGEKLAHTGSWVLNLRSGKLWWSAETFRIFGLHPGAETPSQPRFLSLLQPADYPAAQSTVYPADRPTIQTSLERAIAERKEFEADHRVVHPDGTVRAVRIVGQPVFSDSGELLEYVGVVMDVTERERAGEALRKSERVLREAEELGRTGSWEHDLVTGEIFNTQENLRLFFGDDRSKGARLDDYFDAVHPDDRAMVTALHAQLLAEGGPRDIEFRVVWPDGSVHVLFGRAAVVRDESGRAVRVYGTNLEITERKRAEETLRASQELLQLVLATLPVGVAVTNREGDIVLVNAASKRIWGGDAIVSGRERWAQSKGFWHDSGRKVEPAEWASVRALSEGQTSLNELIDIETLDGKSKTMLNSAAPIRNAEGLIVGAVIINEDVTERVRAEDAVRKNAQQLRDVIDTIPVIAFINMPDGSNEFTNRSWQEYTGLSVKDTAGWGWESTVHPDDITRHVEKYRAAVSAGTTFDNAARYRGTDGQYRWFLVRAVPLRDERGNLLRWYGVLMDIEDRVHAEQALRESANRLQDLSRRLLTVQEEERRHLSRELHDEFGQLLATITVQLHAARNLAGEAARSRLEECAALLQRAGAQVRSLALELRPTMLETAGLDATLRWLAEEHRQRTGITTRVVGHLDDVPADLAIACFRVVQEALTNVVRHARARHVWIELSQTESALELVVRDDGDGFDVTRTLEQAARSGRLGLLGMRERVQILGGSLHVDSESKRGTRIRVSLPLTEVAATPARPVA